YERVLQSDLQQRRGTEQCKNAAPETLCRLFHESGERIHSLQALAAGQQGALNALRKKEVECAEKIRVQQKRLQRLSASPLDQHLERVRLAQLEKAKTDAEQKSSDFAKAAGKVPLDYKQKADKAKDPIKKKDWENLKEWHLCLAEEFTIAPSWNQVFARLQVLNTTKDSCVAAVDKQQTVVAALPTIDSEEKKLETFQDELKEATEERRLQRVLVDGIQDAVYQEVAFRNGPVWEGITRLPIDQRMPAAKERLDAISAVHGSQQAALDSLHKKEQGLLRKGTSVDAEARASIDRELQEVREEVAAKQSIMDNDNEFKWDEERRFYLVAQGVLNERWQRAEAGGHTRLLPQIQSTTFDLQDRLTNTRKEAEQAV
ncbi:MAG TPA: hypothetical protein VIJ14_02640, partial [Rhabdochlamydiaceae bacterium]